VLLSLIAVTLPLPHFNAAFKVFTERPQYSEEWEDLIKETGNTHV
jgi:hypothetical protein